MDGKHGLKDCGKKVTVRWQNVSSAGFLTSTSLASTTERIFFRLTPIIRRDLLPVGRIIIHFAIALPCLGEKTLL